MESKKIGIMGGTFNPIHHGHLILAEEARNYCNLDKVLFMPSGNSYMKNAEEIVNHQIRLHMTALAIEGNEYFELSSMEIERTGATYTYETLSILKRDNPAYDYYFILGADSLFTIEKWKHPEEIFRNCCLIVSVRGTKDTAMVQKKAEELSCKYHVQIILLPTGNIDISSTDIRQRLYTGKSIRYLVPDKVYHYIHANRLYFDTKKDDK